MNGPLSDVTVADFTQMAQGGWATMKLADMGADVIKIEPPWGDLQRQAKPNGADIAGESPWFLALNRNKRSVGIDLTEDQGLDIARDIIKEADCLFENFRPGVMDRLGLGYEAVKEINQDIVYVSGSGWGQSGPYEKRPGQDLLAQATSGLAANTGQADDPPTPAGAFVCDLYSAVTLALHAIIALHERNRTGEGAWVESSLLNAGIDLQAPEFAVALNVDDEIARSENGVGHPMSSAPYGIYESMDGYIAISFGQLEIITDIFDLDPVCDYADETETFQNRDTIKAQIEHETRKRSTDDLLKELKANDVWVSAVNGYGEAASDPQVQHNDMIVEIEHSTAESISLTGNSVSISSHDVPLDSPPTIGEHTRQVLEELGYENSDIDRLLKDSIVIRS